MRLDQSTVEGRGLTPVLPKEIHYHLLLAPNGAMLRQLFAPSSAPSQINTAIALILESSVDVLKVRPLPC